MVIVLCINYTIQFMMHTVQSSWGNAEEKNEVNC
jgi:hypothetical protein